MFGTMSASQQRHGPPMQIVLERPVRAVVDDDTPRAPDERHMQGTVAIAPEKAAEGLPCESAAWLHQIEIEPQQALRADHRSGAG